MAFHTIWSVDLGKSALKAVRLRRDKNNVEILAVDKVDYPISQNGADSAEATKEALSIFRSRNEVRDPLVVCHPGQGTFSRFIKVPAFDDKKVEEMVQYEASQQIPFPLDEVIWDYHLVDREYLSGEERDVGLFAVRREAIDDFLMEFVEEGLSVEMLPIGYLALFNYIKYDLSPEEPSVVLDIGATHTDLILIEGERFWVRPLPHSGQEMTRAIMERFKLKYSEAEKLKTAAAKAPKQATKIFQAVIQPKLKELVQEVQRSIGFYRSQSGAVDFTRVYLVGNGARIIGIKKYLQDQLGMPVHRVQSIHHLRISRDVNVKLLQVQLPSFGTALGAGIQALGVGACDVDLVPREEKAKKAAERKKKHVYFAALVLLGFILLSSAIINSRVGEAERNLQQARALPRTLILKSEGGAKALQVAIDDPVREAKRTVLERIGELRQVGLLGVRALDDVLQKIPTAEVVDERVPVDDPDGESRAQDAGFAALDRKLWIPYLSIELVEWPEDKKDPKTGRVASRGRRAKKGEEKEEKVPAYKHYVYAVVKQGDTEAQAIKDLQAKLQDPLTRKLEISPFTVLKQVELGDGTPDLPSLFHDPERDAAGGSVEQEGRPFFGAGMTWFVIPRGPENFGKKDGEDADADEVSSLDEDLGF